MTKDVSVDGGTTWLPADTTPGPTLLDSFDDPMFRIVVHNTSNVEVDLDEVSDTDFDTATDCSTSVPATLAAGDTYTCAITGTWAVGPHSDTGSASVSFTDGAGNLGTDSLR